MKNSDKSQSNKTSNKNIQNNPNEDNQDTPIKSQLGDQEVFILDHQDARIVYDNGYYGQLRKDKTLSLNFDETLHLVERGVISVFDNKNRELSIDECAKRFVNQEDNFWCNYLVYKDLRNRGYIVGRGFSKLMKYRLYPRGATIGKDIAKTMICPIGESNSYNLDDLGEMVTQAQSLKKKLLIACVDRLGDVSYYEIQSLFKS
jgi:tRNA-intron endonuclease